MQYTTGDQRRRRLPTRAGFVLMPFVLSIIMCFVVSGISTVTSVGLTHDIANRWLAAWALSWVVAFPVLLMVLPVVRRIVAALVEAPAR